MLLVPVGCWKTAERPEQSSGSDQSTANRSAPETRENPSEPSPSGSTASGESVAPTESKTSISAEQIYQRAKASLILVEAQGLKTRRVGSGFLVSPGTVVTNEHVVADASDILLKSIAAQGARSTTGRLAAKHPTADLAILRSEIDAEELPLGRFGTVTVGQSVFVVSNPKGLEATFSKGIVSSIRSNDESTVLQITAPVSEGSSGGPVLNEAGRVIGVVFAVRRGGQNLNFAVPVSYVRKLLRRTR